jgi:hypothetical protein
MTPARARQTIRDLGTCPGFDAALRATLHRRYVSRSTVQEPVTIAFDSRDLLRMAFGGPLTAGLRAVCTGGTVPTGGPLLPEGVREQSHLPP